MRRCERLPAEQSRVIELAYFGGMTHVQIATLLDEPVGNVKGRMRLGSRRCASRSGRRGGGASERSTHPALTRVVRANAAPYVLGALIDEEHRAFVAHLRELRGVPRRSRRAADGR